MEEFKVIVLAVVVMAFVVAGLATQIVLKKGGKFPNIHIGGNKHLKSRGISCAQSDDKIEQAKARKELVFKQLSVDEPDVNGFC